LINCLLCTTIRSSDIAFKELDLNMINEKFELALQIDTSKQMVNLTQMCKMFDRRLDYYLKAGKTQELIRALDELTPGGGSCINSENGNGTWGNEELALDLAQWLDVKFKVYCTKKLKELFTTGSTSINSLVPTNLKEALLLAYNQQVKLEQQTLLLLEQQPKVEFAEAVMQSKDEISIGGLASVLNIKGLGQNKLFALLRGYKILKNDKSKKSEYNTPYRDYIERGWFRVVETPYKQNDEVGIHLKTVVYQKGVAGIRNLLINKGV
jgi:phage antirepressor YoqD-like protein